MTRLGVKRIIFWLLLTAAVAGSVWWTLTISYRPGAVLDAIPENAVWVSLHQDPASRRTEWSRNGAIRSLTGFAGLNMDALDQEMATPKGLAWLKRLGGREVAIAYAPRMPYSDEAAWIISCWAGGYSQRLRWLLALSGAKPVEGSWSDGAHPIWLMKVSGLPRGTRLAMGIRDGVVVLVVSADPIPAMRACLDTAEDSPHALSVRKARHLEALWTERLGASAPLDRGWLHTAGWGDMVVGAQDLKADRFQAIVKCPPPPPESLALTATGDVSVLEGLMGKAEGTATVPWPLVRNYLLTQPGDWIAPVDLLVREAAGTEQARLMVGIYGGDYAARLKSLFGGGIESFIQGLKVPTFVLAVPVSSEAAALEAVSRFLDRINRIKPYGLVLRPAGVCYGWNVTAFEATRGTLYKDFALSEQVAFAVTDGWLVVGSHLGALQELLPSIPHGKAPGPVQAGVHMEMDAPAFSQTMGKFLAALSLAYVVADTPEAEQARARMAEWREWLKATAPLGRVELECAGGVEGLTLSILSTAVTSPTPGP
jgi:hypothetical protein